MPLVLVVDDDRLLRTAIMLTLEGAGLTVRTAADGAEGMEAAQQFHPALILLDLMMPVMDGWTFLEKRQLDATLAGIPVVVVSAVADERLVDADNLQVTAVVAKPFNPRDLVQLVQNIVSPEGRTSKE